MSTLSAHPVRLVTTVYVLVGIGILLALITTVAAKVSQMPLLHAPKAEPTVVDGHVAAAGAVELPGQQT